MKFKFHYNEKVKVVHGFYAGNTGVVQDHTMQDVKGKMVSTTWHRWWGCRFPVSKMVECVVGQKRLYKVYFPAIKTDGKWTDVPLAWVEEQHLERA